jgi:hypothetical protein
MAFLAYTSLFTAMLAACHALVGRPLHLRHLRPSRWLTGTWPSWPRPGSRP